MAEARDLWLGLGKSWKSFWESTPYEAAKIIGAFLKHEFRNVVMVGWYGEYFARQKRLKGLSHYLEEPKKKSLIKTGETMNAGPWLALMGG